MKELFAGLMFVLIKLKKTLPEIVKEIEKRAKDGIIDAKDRKAIAMKAINEISETFGKKLGLIPRLIVSKLIDKAAKLLPSKDLKVPEIIADICKVRSDKRKTTKRKRRRK